MLLDANDSRFQFASEEDARIKMKAYIEENFSELLGDEIKILNLPNGFEILSARIRYRLAVSNDEIDELSRAA